MRETFSLNRFMSVAKEFLQNRDGNFTMINALMIIPLVGVSGAAIDYSFALNARTKMQQMTDVAALAAAKAITKNPQITDAKLQSLVKDIFKSSSKNGPFLKKVNPVFKRLKKGVRVDAKTSIGTNVIQVLGIDEIDVAVFSESAPSAYKKIELALVLDNTGSMSSGGRMHALKEASKLLINTLIPAGTKEENVKISIVPYDVTVNIGTSFAGESWIYNPDAAKSKKKSKKKKNKTNWCGLVKPANTDYVPVVSPSTIETYNESCGYLPTILALTPEAKKLKNKINSMSPNGWTYIPAGLMWGWRTIDPGNPYTQAKPYTDEKWQKMIVLMTDGQNTSKWSNGKLFTSMPPGPGDAKTKNICRDIKKKKIRIFTIAFGLSSSSTTKLLRECATNDTDFFATHTSAGLKAAFSSIAGSINKTRLTK